MTPTEEWRFGMGRMMLSALCLLPLAVLLGVATRSEAAVAGKYKSADTEAVRFRRAPVFMAREFYDD